MAKSVDVIFTISISVVETLEVICATAPVVSPYTFSPITDSVSKLNPEGNVNLSSVGDKVFVDSKIPIILTASGTLRDISRSSTRKP